MADNLSTASEFTVGSVLGRSWQTLSRGWGVFLGLLFIPFLISLLLIPLLAQYPNLLKLLRRVLDLTIQGATAYAAYRIMTAQRASLGDSLTRSLSRILPVIGIALMFTLATVLPIWIVGFFAMITRMRSEGIAILLLIVLAAFVVTFLIAWSVAIPACVIEHLGPIQSLKRSENLTRGNRWKITGIFLLGYLALGVIAYATNKILGTALGASLIRSLLLLVPWAFIAVLTPVTYYDLRAVKEGVSLESLANVFD